ncbi:MAG: acyl-CoA dehydrogenase family protein [Acinetobacter sp.]
MCDFIQLAYELAQKIQVGACERDLNRILPVQEMELIRQSNLGAARLPLEYGGGDISFVDVANIFAILAKADACVAQALFPHFATVEHLRLIATSAQQSYYFTQIASPKLTSGAIAERSGKFRGEISTQLSLLNGQYFLNGTKFYSTGCLFADFIKVQAINEKGEAVYVMIPKDASGLNLLDDWDGMGQRTTASGTTQLNNIAVHPDWIIPLHLWTNKRNYIGAVAQLIHCSIDVGIGLAALDEAIQWIGKGVRPVKESGVERAADDPYILYTIGELSAQIHAAEALVESAARKVDLASKAQLSQQLDIQDIERLLQEASIAVAEAKILSTRASLFVCERLYEVGGAATTQRKLNFDRYWRNARTHTTHDSLAYKYKTIGNYLVNDVAPPISFLY